MLVKAVPRSEAVRYDAATRRMDRDGVELVLNPFDARAVRVALDLRRPGERVSVVSMGPPGSEPPLRRLRGFGVDRVLLLSDPALAGSDTLVTARVLVAGLERTGHDVVLAGARTTDSDTGQVGAEVAALLGVPLVSEARSIRRDTDGPGFEVEVDTATGWARARLSAPFVVSVDEKIAKPVPTDPGAAAPGPEGPVERFPLPALGLDADRVGAPGSPTIVGPIREAVFPRTPRIYAGGPLEDRVRSAIGALSGLLARPPPREMELPPAPAPLDDGKEVLVLVTGGSGELEPFSLGLVSEVRRALPGHGPAAVWVGRPPSEAATFRLERAGTLAGYLVPATDPDPRTAALAFDRVLALRPRAAGALFLSDPFGREVAGRLAAGRALGLIGDAVSLTVDPVAGIVGSKPSFGGRTVAEIRSRTRPVLLTVRPGTFPPASGSAPEGGFGWRTLPAVHLPPAVDWTASGRELEGFLGPESRDVLVAVGLGIGGPEGVARVRAQVGPWEAGIVATRKVVDRGWVPRQLQVGLTGRALAPRLAVLLGISGSPNHMTGWSRAPALLAVNRDPNAPVFRDVDVGIVGSIDEVLPALVEPVARLLRR